MDNLLQVALPEVLHQTAVNLILAQIDYIGQVLNFDAIDQNFVPFVLFVVPKAHEPVLLVVVKEQWICDQTIQIPIPQTKSDTFMLSLTYIDKPIDMSAKFKKTASYFSSYSALSTILQ